MSKLEKKGQAVVRQTKGKTAIEIEEGGFDKRVALAESTGASQ